MDDLHTPDTPQDAHGVEAPHLETVTGVPASEVADQKAAAKGDGVVLRTVYPSDEFVHGVKGADVVTAHGTEVTATQAKAILKAADNTRDVQVEEVS